MVGRKQRSSSLTKQIDDYNDIRAMFSTNTDWCLDDYGRIKQSLYVTTRPTISVALIRPTREGGEVLLVKSKKSQSSKTASWILPQGGIEKGKTIYQAAATELWQELGLELSADDLIFMQNQKVKKFSILGTYTNAPRNEGDIPKQVICVGVSVGSYGDIMLNEENEKFAIANNPFVLWRFMAHDRRRKLLGTCYALNQAEPLGLRWSCDVILQQYNNESINWGDAA